MTPIDSEGVIRCSPGEDHTNGFFVSCFVKVSADVVDLDKNVKRKWDEEAGASPVSAPTYDSRMSKKQRKRKKV